MSDVSQTTGREPDESTLIRYLVGRASEDETEQLDELSTVDEEFSLRLRAVEHDLVDAYVDGQLTGETLEGFRAHYLRSPAGLAAVEFAEALRGYRRAAVAEPPATSAARTRRSLFPQWWLATAAVLALATSAYLLVDNLRIRDRITDVREANAALEQRVRQLQDEVNRQQSATRATEEALARARDALAQGPPRAAGEPRAGVGRVLAFTLIAATRGGNAIASITIPTGVDAVTLRLPLVAVDFPQYEVVLRDATADRVIWRSGRLRAPSGSERPALSVTVRATLLEPRGYAMELTGISAPGRAEPLDSYPFRVVP
jgi:hypothetical protein